MAGAVGFEPTHTGTKVRCLTAWLRPIKKEKCIRKNLKKKMMNFIHHHSQDLLRLPDQLHHQTQELVYIH